MGSVPIRNIGGSKPIPKLPSYYDNGEVNPNYGQLVASKGTYNNPTTNAPVNSFQCMEKAYDRNKDCGVGVIRHLKSISLRGVNNIRINYQVGAYGYDNENHGTIHIIWNNERKGTSTEIFQDTAYNQGVGGNLTYADRTTIVNVAGKGYTNGHFSLYATSSGERGDRSGYARIVSISTEN